MVWREGERVSNWICDHFGYGGVEWSHIKQVAKERKNSTRKGLMFDAKNDEVNGFLNRNNSKSTRGLETPFSLKEIKRVIFSFDWNKVPIVIASLSPS